MSGIANAVLVAVLAGPAVLLIAPGLLPTLIGAAIAVPALWNQWRQKPHTSAAPAPVG